MERFSLDLLIGHCLKCRNWRLECYFSTWSQKNVKKKFFCFIFGFCKLEIKFCEKTNIGVVFPVKKYINLCRLDVWKKIFSSIQNSVTTRRKLEKQGDQKNFSEKENFCFRKRNIFFTDLSKIKQLFFFEQP